MSSAMVPLAATGQRVVTLECAPCALRCAMQRCGQPSWTPPLADFAVDIVAGALALADATEVLVPSSLVHYLELHRGQKDCAWSWPAWDTAVADGRLVAWTSAHDAVRFLDAPYGSRYTRLCVPVPAGPLVAQMDFGTPLDVFYSTALLPLLDRVAAQRDANRAVRWRAWMRGALTCAYEGTHVPPIRVSDLTSQLLRRDGGCDSVVWEAAVNGLTPRWLETAAKTALAVGIRSSSSLALALPEESSSTARLLFKSVEVGISSWATCALPTVPLYPHADPLCVPQSVLAFRTGWNDVSATDETDAEAAVSAAETSLVRCADFVDAVSQQHRLLLPPLEWGKRTHTRKNEKKSIE